MAFLEGISLGEQINCMREKKEMYEEPRIWKMVLQLIQALRYLHKSKGIIHRDLTPCNIIIGDKDYVTITDFGLAKQRLLESSGRDARSILGTLTYVWWIFYRLCNYLLVVSLVRRWYNISLMGRKLTFGHSVVLYIRYVLSLNRLLPSRSWIWWIRSANWTMWHSRSLFLHSPRNGWIIPRKFTVSFSIPSFLIPRTDTMFWVSGSILYTFVSSGLQVWSTQNHL